MKIKKEYCCSRFLITINVFGSAGPMRFIVNGDDITAQIIQKALKLYAREGRLPILGSDIYTFSLYPANIAGFNALKSSEAIGLCGVRNFVLCKKQLSNPNMSTEAIIDGKGSRWRIWFQKSLSFKILSN